MGKFLRRFKRHSEKPTMASPVSTRDVLSYDKWRADQRLAAYRARRFKHEVQTEQVNK